MVQRQTLCRQLHVLISLDSVKCDAYYNVPVFSNNYCKLFKWFAIFLFIYLLITLVLACCLVDYNYRIIIFNI